eukprot:CAMPEP_0167743864 /NCGR_PEP_ID=MMETSP0110_2-20121227/2253_1 /TAXON_ID=629695 /ORGANISM="Gymnochlora sp., Strain CCMP2014" /LENGTH=179 /DNA_ID=CAMNT_0007628283 /DNA_START=191 /DNA_END=730 /DNA_ORIENTATION=-
MICFAIIIIMWEISAMHRRPNHWLHIALEGIISLFLIGETVAFLMAMGTSYFRQWIHVADLIITVGCAIVFIGLVIDEMVESFDWPEEVELSVLLVRYTLMAGRLLFLFYRSGRADSIRKAENVRFSKVFSAAQLGKTSSSSLFSRESSPAEKADLEPQWLVSITREKNRYDPLNRPLE